MRAGYDASFAVLKERQGRSCTSWYGPDRSAAARGGVVLGCTGAGRWVTVPRNSEMRSQPAGLVGRRAFVERDGFTRHPV
jgi:hypothetical protein